MNVNTFVNPVKESVYARHPFKKTVSNVFHEEAVDYLKKSKFLDCTILQLLDIPYKAGLGCHSRTLL